MLVIRAAFLLELKTCHCSCFFSGGAKVATAQESVEFAFRQLVLSFFDGLNLLFVSVRLEVNIYILSKNYANH